MKEEEYADLNVLKKRFDQKTNENHNKIKKKRKNFEIKLENKSFKKTLIRYATSFFKNLFSFSKKTTKKIIEISSKQHKKVRKHVNEYIKNKQKNIAFKIVETKKEKRNKVVIVRKRVPIESSINFKPIDSRPSLYYCSLHPEENKFCEKKIIGHVKLEKSVWDFPIKK